VKTHKGELSFALRDSERSRVDGRGAAGPWNPASREADHGGCGALGARTRFSGSTSGCWQARPAASPRAGDSQLTAIPPSPTKSARLRRALGGARLKHVAGDVLVDQSAFDRLHAPGLRAAARRVGGVRARSTPVSLDRNSITLHVFRPKPASLRASSSSRPATFRCRRGCRNPKRARSATTSGHAQAARSFARREVAEAFPRVNGGAPTRRIENQKFTPASC